MNLTPVESQAERDMAYEKWRKFKCRVCKKGIRLTHKWICSAGKESDKCWGVFNGFEVK